jgi:hypothetical protein
VVLLSVRKTTTTPHHHGLITFKAVPDNLGN